MPNKDDAFLDLAEIFQDALDTEKVIEIFNKYPDTTSVDKLVAAYTEEAFKGAAELDTPTPKGEPEAMVSLIPATLELTRGVDVDAPKEKEKLPTDPIPAPDDLDEEMVPVDRTEESKAEDEQKEQALSKEEREKADAELARKLLQQEKDAAATLDEASANLKKKVVENLKGWRKQMAKTTCETAAEMLQKVLQKILENPGEEKFRTIKRGKKAWQSKVGRIPGAEEILVLAGFAKVEGQDGGILMLNANSADPARLFLVKDAISSHTFQDADLDKKPLPTVTGRTQVSRQRADELAAKREKTNARKRPIPQLSKDEIREKRLRALENPVDPSQSYEGPGPRKGRDFDPSKPSLQKQLKEIRSKKHRKYRNTRMGRKRMFTMDDISNMQQRDKEATIRGQNKSGEMDQLGKEMLKYTNEFREKHGLPALKWSQPLADIGKKHSKAMGDKKAPFSHDGFNDRVKAYPQPAAAAAENLAMSSGLGRVARTAVDGWIDSPGHRKNLLHPAMNYCGIGVYRNAGGAYYSTQLFGRF